MRNLYTDHLDVRTYYARNIVHVCSKYKIYASETVILVIRFDLAVIENIYRLLDHGEDVCVCVCARIFTKINTSFLPLRPPIEFVRATSDSDNIAL